MYIKCNTMSRILCITLLVSAALFDAVSGDCSCRKNENNRQSSYTCTECEEFPFEQLPTDAVLLHMSENSLSEIPVLTNYTALEFVDLSHNSIATIMDGAFKECSIISLNLTSNRLTTLNSKMFEGMDEVRHLLLGFNDIEKLDEMELFRENSRNLEVLNLTSNKINEINHDALSDLSKLKELDLSGNKMEWHHYLHFAGLNQLERLYLNDNMLVNLSKSVFADMDNLIMLDLRHNQIDEIENMAFQGLQSSLQYLHLSFNKIKVIHEEFRILTALTNLFLNNNPIVEFRPNALPANIENFNMENCPEIDILPNNTFMGLNRLKTVYIKGNNKLLTIEPEAFDMSGRMISVVDLSSNALEHLDFQTLLWQNVSHLDLSDNNWDCDCTLSWMKIKLSPEIQKSVKCQTPYQINGKSIQDLQFDEFSCEFFVRYRRSLAVTLILIITVLFVMLAAFLIYKKRRRVLPCIFKNEKSYRTLYNTGDPEETAVSVRPTVDYVEEGDDLLPPAKPKREFRDSLPRVAAV